MPDNFFAAESSHAPAFPTFIANDISLILERHPNIGKRITQLWGSVDLHKYLNSIIFDERGGRQGFHETIVSALFRIHEAHGKLTPTARAGDIWDVITERLELNRR